MGKFYPVILHLIKDSVQNPGISGRYEPFSGYAGVRRGTFYYDGARIEPEDGTVLRFTTAAITDTAGHTFTRQ